MIPPIIQKEIYLNVKNINIDGFTDTFYGFYLSAMRSDLWITRFFIIHNTDFLSYGRALLKYSPPPADFINSEISKNTFFSQDLIHQIGSVDYQHDFIDPVALQFVTTIGLDNLNTFLKNNPIEFNEATWCETVIRFINQHQGAFNETVDSIMGVLHTKVKFVKNKEFFEALPWVNAFVNAYVKLTIFGLVFSIILGIKYQIDEKPTAFNHELYTKISIVAENMTSNFDEEEFNAKRLLYASHYVYNKFLIDVDFKDYLTCKHNLRLDFTSSGIQLISMLVANEPLMVFSGVKASTSGSATTSSYNMILEIIKKKYKEDTTYLGINKYLNHFSVQPEVQPFLLDLIISKTTVKNIAMLIGYNGTMYNFKENFKQRIKDTINYNVILLPSDYISYTKDLEALAHNICHEIYDIMIENYPALQYMLNLTHVFSEQFKAKDQATGGKLIRGISVEYPHTRYNLAPTKIKSMEIKTTDYNPKTKKLGRLARHIVSYYTQNLDYRKLYNSLSANVIQGLDSCQLYFFKELLRLFFPDKRISAIHDAYIFETTFIKTEVPKDLSINACFDDSYQPYTSAVFVKNLLRIATCLTLGRTNILQQIVKINNFTFSDSDTIAESNKKKENVTALIAFIQSGFKNHFHAIPPCKFEIVFTSNLFSHIFANQQFWFYPDSNVNKNFFRRCLHFFSPDDFHAYRLYLKKHHPYLASDNILDIYISPNQDFPDIEHELNRSKKDIITEYLMKEIASIMQDFQYNFNPHNENSLISKLSAIMSNDDFVKF